MYRSESKAIVGVPFYDGEGFDVLAACIGNLDRCLNNLHLDAQVLVAINGPRVSLGLSPLSYKIDRSKYNSDVRFIRTRPGIVAAELAICQQAIKEGYSRIFLTDSDISRLPYSLSHLWGKGEKPVIGANYCTYPLEILNAAGINLSSTEVALMKIFEADKHPLAREFTWAHRPKTRLKGSLLLIESARVIDMFGFQRITSDSVMNQSIPESDKQLVPDAAFMHYGRISIVDHIQGRLRHFRAAAAVGNLDGFSKKSIIYDRRTADDIASSIVAKNPESPDVASNFLLQCALRHEVTDICRRLTSNKPAPDYSVYDGKYLPSQTIYTFQEASKAIKNLLSQIDLHGLNLPVTNGNGITQENLRVPIDLTPYLFQPEYRSLIASYLGLSADVEL